MNRGTWLIIALLSATPALAQDQGSGAKAEATPKQHTKKPAPGAKGSKAPAKKPEAGGSAAWGTGDSSKGSAASKKSATAAPKHVAERANMLRLRSIFRYAVESCATPSKSCDTTLRDDAEHRFMDGCLPCATREQCEAERDQIRAGTSKSGTDLCSD